MTILLVILLLFAKCFITICTIIFVISLMACKKQVGARTNFNPRVSKGSVAKKKDDTSKKLDEASQQSDTPEKKPKSEELDGTTSVSESKETEDEFTPITVADDEYYEPPKAKSSIEYEEDPADDADIIQDAGEASFYESLAKQQERLEVS